MRVGAMYRNNETKGVVIVVENIKRNGTSANHEHKLRYVNLAELHTGALTVMSSPNPELFAKGHTLIQEGP